MWSDNDIDNAFRRLAPAEPEPTPFPLDAWLKVEAGLNQAVIDRAVSRRLWQFFAVEMAVVALLGLGWSLWPAGAPVAVGTKPTTAAVTASPTGRTADAKQTRSLGASAATIPVAPAVRPAVVGMAQALPRPATTPPVAASQAIASAAEAAATSTAPRGAAGRGRQLPLAVAVAPARCPAPAARFHPAEGQAAVSGKGVAMLVGPPRSHSENASPVRAARREAAAYSRAIAASAGGAGAGTPTLAHPKRSNPEKAGRFASSQTATPSGAAREVVAVGAASSGGGQPAEQATRQPAAAYRADGTLAADVPTSSTTAAPARSSDAADASPVPVAPTAAALTLPPAAPVPTQLAPAELTPNPQPAIVRQPRFYVGVVAAPDVSTVKFADVRPPHLSVGLTLEYRLGQRWRVATGVQRAAKEYIARRQDYDWGYPSRAYTRDFTWVNGSCTILDVPLNLRYDAVVASRYRVFGTAGLSSFFMQRERYTYDYYDNVSNTPAVWERSFVNANQHFFSVLNLSAGYEYGLGTHWRLQAEPYVKVPLAGVGAGKVKLLSAGFNFGVKYGF